MTRLMKVRTVFKTFKHARHTTDVSFNWCKHAVPSMEEEEAYFSKKHTLYGLNVEVGVFPVGHESFLTKHCRCCTSDITILRKTLTEHFRRLEEGYYQTDIADDGK